MNTLQQGPQVNPAFDESVLKAAGITAQIEQKAIVIASELLDAVMVAYDEDKPNKSLIPVFIQHITEAIATARAEGAAEDRNKAIKIVEQYRNHINELQAKMIGLAASDSKIMLSYDFHSRSIAVEHILQALKGKITNAE